MIAGLTNGELLIVGTLAYIGYTIYKPVNEVYRIVSSAEDVLAQEAHTMQSIGNVTWETANDMGGVVSKTVNDISKFWSGLPFMPSTDTTDAKVQSKGACSLHESGRLSCPTA